MFRKLSVPVLAVALLAGCASTPPAAEVVPGASSPIDLVNLWRVTDADGEAVDTWLRLDAGDFQLWRECGIISGSWRATDSLMLASVSGSSGSCANETLPSINWLESVTSFAPATQGWQLLDAAGSPVATLTIDGAPEPIATAADFYAEAPEITAETRAFFAEAAPLSSTLTPGPIDGRWTSEAVDASTGAGVEFAADGSWTGSDGCNGGEGRWAIGANGSFLATSGLSTLMYCDGAPVPSWVATAQRAGFDGNVLVLLDADGTELGRLVAD